MVGAAGYFGRRLAEGVKSPAAVCPGWSAVPALSVAWKEVEGDGLLRRVCVVADQDGPAIAVMPAVLMAARLAASPAPAGLMPLDGWLDRAALERACRDFGFRFVFEERHA